MEGFEPPTNRLTADCTTTVLHPNKLKWLAERDLNLRPQLYQSCALTT